MAGGCPGCPSFQVQQPRQWLCRCPHQSRGHPAPGAGPRSEVPLGIRRGPGHCQAPQGCRLPALHIYMRVVSTAASIANQRCASSTLHIGDASSASPAQSWVHSNLDRIKIHRKVAKPQAVGWNASCCRVKGAGCERHTNAVQVWHGKAGAHACNVHRGCSRTGQALHQDAQICGGPSCMARRCSARNQLFTPAGSYATECCSQ